MSIQSNWAFVFPGQGSQEPGMGQSLFNNFSVAKNIFHEASEALSLDMAQLCFHSDAGTLQLTSNTQPAILVTSIAALKVLESEFDLKPSYVAGHSVGEYAALIAAEVISFSDGIQAVRKRGQWMQEASPKDLGGMVAVIGLSNEEALELCEYISNKTGFYLSCANFNCPGQVVLSGEHKAIEYLSQVFTPQDLWQKTPPPRIKMIPLSVSAPFHCQLMNKAEENMKYYLEKVVFHAAKVPVIQNLTAEPTKDSSQIKDQLIKQISAPVLWTQTMDQLKKLGVTQAIEVGHGKVIQGLFKKADLGIKVLPFGQAQDIIYFKEFNSL